MERFLRYSLDHNREIRMIWIGPDGEMHEGKVVVEAMETDRVRIYVLRPPQRMEIRTEDVLSCDYVSGDEGLN